MANIRTLKKEIDTCVYEVISDCLTYSALNPEKNQDDVSSLISEAVMLRNNLFRKINAPLSLSLIHISEPTRLLSNSYAVFCLKKKNKNLIKE